MTLLEHQIATLSAPAGDLGQIRIERIDGDLVLGEFAPGEGYEPVRSLFAAFEDAVEQQALSEVDRLDQQIAMLDLHVRLGGGSAVPISDAQVYRDGGVSFRLAAGRNGARHG